MIYAALIAALLIRPHKAAFTFVAVASLFNLACGNLDGSYYLPLAALCDFTVVGLLFNFRIDRKVFEMMVMSMISLTLNLVGWLLWFTYQAPDLYVNLFGVFYVVVIMLILRKDDAHDMAGDTGFYIDYASHHPDANTSGRLG